jgi:hypothetical protein
LDAVSEANKELSMLYVVRGTLGHTGEDVSIVVEAQSGAEAEYIGARRGIPVVIVSPASDEDVATAKLENRFFVYSRAPQWQAFGTPVGAYQLASLMLSGVATIVVLLKVAHLLPF